MNYRKRLEKFIASSIYPIIIPEFCKRSPEEVLEETLKGGAKIIQLRDKNNPEKHAKEFRKITQKYEALFIVNDFIEIALKYSADGIHLGQEDLSLKEAKKVAPDILIGISVNTKDEALCAERDGASYVNLGVAFETKTKGDVKSVTGLTFIKEVSPFLKIPFTVIGGINRNNIEELVKIGAKHIAIASAITMDDNPQEATKFFTEKMLR